MKKNKKAEILAVGGARRLRKLLAGATIGDFVLLSVPAGDEYRKWNERVGQQIDSPRTSRNVTIEECSVRVDVAGRFNTVVALHRPWNFTSRDGMDLWEMPVEVIRLRFKHRKKAPAVALAEHFEPLKDSLLTTDRNEFANAVLKAAREYGFEITDDSVRVSVV